jgi:predicted RNA-binding protein with PUA-like domain
VVVAYWVLKTEPTDYSFEDLLREGETEWAGVKNAVAVRNLKAMKKGDGVMIYHTGKEKAVVGLAKVVQAAEGVVRVKAEKRLERAVTLAEIKGREELASWGLVRMGRLSVVPATEGEWACVIGMGEGEG